MYLVTFMSGDRRRTLTREVVATDIDHAASKAVCATESGEFGAKASWFVAGVVQLDCVSEVAATIETYA